MTDRQDAPGTRPGHGALPRAVSDPQSNIAAADRDRLDSLARGDHAALSALYESWFPRALGLARTMTRRDEAFCLDVVQETFVRVIDHAPRLAQLAGHDDLDRWMAAVVRSAAIDLLRRDLRRAAREAASQRRTETVLLNDSHASVAELQSLIAALHPDDQELLMLRFGRGATLDGAARAVGTTIGAAYGRIRRSLQKLGKNLQEVDHE
jgi:RNA polymerase sigma factor (sigma-70 family)